jgi:hypothetical protein
MMFVEDIPLTLVGERERERALSATPKAVLSARIFTYRLDALLLG